MGLVVATPAFGEGVAFDRLDKLYAHRDEPEAHRILESELEAALSKYPTDYDVLWRAARSKAWDASQASDERHKKRLGRQGWDLARRGLERRPDGPEAHYWAAISIGTVMQATNRITLLMSGLLGEFETHVTRAVELDPWMNAGAPQVVLARLLYELPWPKRDLKRSAELLEHVVAKHPENLRAWLSLAETRKAQGRSEDARTALAKVRDGSIDWDPPQGRLVKAQLETSPAARE
jgi:cytochrome c-type biogenesis protein CcmH/NrfG